MKRPWTNGGCRTKKKKKNYLPTLVDFSVVTLRRTSIQTKGLLDGHVLLRCDDLLCQWSSDYVQMQDIQKLSLYRTGSQNFKTIGT
jgi:hypothetical protein